MLIICALKLLTGVDKLVLTFLFVSNSNPFNFVPLFKTSSYSNYIKR
jgi:hypothetical protein